MDLQLCKVLVFKVLIRKATHPAGGANVASFFLSLDSYLQMGLVPPIDRSMEAITLGDEMVISR